MGRKDKGVAMANFVLELLTQHPEGLSYQEIYETVNAEFQTTPNTFRNLMCKYIKDKVKKIRVNTNHKIGHWVWKLNGEFERIEKPKRKSWNKEVNAACLEFASYAEECLLRGEIPVLDGYSKCYICMHFKHRNGKIWCDVGGLEGQVFEVGELLRDIKNKSFHISSSYKELIRQLRKARRCNLS